MKRQYLTWASTARWVVFFLLGNLSTAFAESLMIPRDRIGAPAKDLLIKKNPSDPGTPVDQGTLIHLQKSGKDISTLDPSPHTDVWGTTPTFDTEIEASYPKEKEIVNYFSFLPAPSSAHIFRAQVYVQRQEGAVPVSFALNASLEGHAALLRAALLRALGYRIAPSRHYEALTIQFPDIATRDLFLDTLSNQTLTHRNRWIRNLDEKKPEVTLQDVILEPAQVKTANYHWSQIKDYHNVAGSDLYERRIIRSLVVPLTLGDIPENINVYSFEMGRIRDESVVFTLPTSGAFTDATIDDARWMGRKIAKLSRAELQAIVREGHYPPEVEPLLVEKIIGRRDQMLSLLRLENEFKPMGANLELETGAVKGSKLTQSEFSGHAERFAYGDIENPMRLSEIGRFLHMQAYTTILSNITSKINEYITAQSQADAILNAEQQYQKTAFESFIKHIMERKTGSFSAPIKTWAFPVGGAHITVDRSLVTGSYYGGDQNIQLVDNIGVQVNVGFFGGVMGITTAFPTFGANMTLQRNYIHVRPVAKIQDALDAKWKDLWINRYLIDLSKILSPTESLDPANAKENLKKFMDQLKEGEVFMTTDSFIGGASGQVNIPIMPLLQAGFVGLSPTVGIGAGVQGAIFKRTIINRTAAQGENLDGIQVYFQNILMGSTNLSFSFDYYINLMKYMYSVKVGDSKVKAYIVNKGDHPEGWEPKLVAALRGVLEKNDDELMAASFPPYTAEHVIKAQSHSLSMLLWKWKAIREGHTLTVLPPPDPSHGIVPEEHKRILYRDSATTASGTSWTSLISNIIQGVTSQELDQPVSLFSNNAGDNPANSFMGTARWKTVSTEAEITPSRPGDAVSRVEHHWRGWYLPKKRFFKVIDAIEDAVLPLNGGVPMVRRADFNDMKAFELYDISTSFLLYNKGILKIVDALVPEKMGARQAFNNLVALDGGPEQFQLWCAHYGPRFQSDPPSFTDLMRDPNAYSEATGRWTSEDFPCIKPWMKTLMMKRLKYPKDDLKARIRWISDVVRVLEDNTRMTDWVNWLGRDNVFFQIRLIGFRSHMELQSNIEGDKAGNYYSDSIGVFNQKDGAGAFREFAEKYGFSNYEVSAQYLSDNNF